MLLASEVPIEGEKREAYAAALSTMGPAGIPFLVGGGFAMHQYLQRWRSTKDLDLFIRESDLTRTLDVLSRAGFRVELTDASWLAKAFRDGMMVDLIFSSYNGLFPVDDRWFENGRPARLMGVDVQLVGPEEMIVSKAFVAARDRFDGSDISWLIRTLDGIDWRRVESHMAEHWEVLLWQLIHYRYVFPDQRDKVPESVVLRLLRRARDALPSGASATAEGAARVSCRGPLLDPIHYLAAVLERSPDLARSAEAARELKTAPWDDKGGKDHAEGDR